MSNLGSVGYSSENEKESLNFFSSWSTDSLIPVISLFLAVLISLSTLFFCVGTVDNLNDDLFGHITIQDKPELLTALKQAQTKGVILGIHGWEHENYSSITPSQVKGNVEKAKSVFEKAGLVPAVFISPLEISGVPAVPSIRKTIESTHVATQLPPLKTDGNRIEVNEYTWNWYTMESTEDPRFQEASKQIRIENPKMIVFHAQDWNPYLKQFLISYLSTTSDNNITVRMDDVEVNTPKEVIQDVSQVTQYKSVGRVVFAVIPSGIWKGGNPLIQNIKVNNVMRMYFWFFIITSLLPLSFFVIWKLLAGWNNKMNQNKYPMNNHDGEYPKLISILVPAYNEEKSIGKCLNSILDQDYEGKTEIIVVNDGSSDRTADIVSKYPVKFIDLRVNGGKANALNKAIEEAKGDILIFTDSDSYMETNAVSSLVKCLNENSDAQVVAGKVLVHDDRERKPFMKYFQMIEYIIEQDLTRYLQSLKGNVLVCPGPVTAVRRKVCEEVKFSDETIVEDADFTIKVLKKSIKIVQEPGAKVYTNAPETLKAWYTQRKRWWYGNLQVWRLHKHWAVRNPWMLLNYLGYVIGVCSVIMAILLPFFLLKYDNILLISLRGGIYVILPVLLYIIFMALFFKEDKKLLPMLIPYVLVYSTIKVATISYLYTRYLTGMGLNVRFGPRKLKVK